MQVGTPVVGNEIKVGSNTFLRLRNGGLWIELDYDPEEDYTYVYEVLDPYELEKQYAQLLQENIGRVT